MNRVEIINLLNSTYSYNITELSKDAVHSGTHVMPAFWRLRHSNHEFEVSLADIMIFGLKKKSRKIFKQYRFVSEPTK